MAAEKSQQKMIYHFLLRQIKMGNYKSGDRFPTVKEIADHFNVSYCPAQIALKTLEKDGYVQLSKGKTAEIIWQPDETAEKTLDFEERRGVLKDLYESLCHFSPLSRLQGLSLMDEKQLAELEQLLTSEQEPLLFSLYKGFEVSLQPMKNQMLMYLFTDVDAFVGTVLVDRMKDVNDGQGDMALEKVRKYLLNAIRCIQKKEYTNGFEQLSQLSYYLKGFFDINQNEVGQCAQTEAFSWEPQKGRKRYCDDIAIDLICKINQGVYPVDSYLPQGRLLADIYHVSPITIRRTISILNELGVAKNINGVGTKVIFPGDRTILYKMKDMTMDRNLIQFLEALQILAITGESVALSVFPFFDENAFQKIKEALKLKGDERSKIQTFAACLQAVVHCAPFAAVREIYSKLTLMTLKGSVLRLESTGDEKIVWWAEMAERFENSLDNKDAALFSKTLFDLFYRSFCSTRKMLCEIGVEQAGLVAVPIIFK